VFSRVTEARPGFAAARWALGRGHVGPPCSRAWPRRAPASPRRDERLGRGHVGPRVLARDRGAARFIRAATSAGGMGGHVGAPHE